MADKKIQLSADDSTIYAVLWDAFRIGYGKYAKGFNGVQLCNQIRKQLDSISCPAATDKDPFARKMKPGPQVLLLSAMQYDVLRQMLENEDVSWVFVSGDAVERAMVLVRDAADAKLMEVEASDD